MKRETTIYALTMLTLLFAGIVTVVGIRFTNELVRQNNLLREQNVVIRDCREPKDSGVEVGKAERW